MLRTFSRSGLALPEQYYKVILYHSSPTIRMIGFLLINEPSKEPLRSFVMSVDQTEKLTGINFFPFIPDDLKHKLESGRDVGDWFGFWKVSKNESSRRRLSNSKYLYSCLRQVILE